MSSFFFIINNNLTYFSFVVASKVAFRTPGSSTFTREPCSAWRGRGRQVSIKHGELKGREGSQGHIRPRVVSVSRFDQEDKVRGTVLYSSLMLDVTIAVGVLNVPDGCEPGKEAVGDINGDCYPWAEVSHVLVNKVGGGGIFELRIQGFPASRTLSWRKDSDDVDGVQDGGGDLHLAT